MWYGLSRLQRKKKRFVWQVNVIVFAQEVVLDSQPAVINLNGRSLLYKTIKEGVPLLPLFLKFQWNSLS